MKKVALIVLNNFINDIRVYKECKSLINAGFDATVIALFDKNLQEHENIDGVKVHRIKLKTRSWSKFKPIQFIKYIEFIVKFTKCYKNYDIFHCNDLNTLPIGVFIKKYFNKKANIIYDAHEYETERRELKAFEKILLKIIEKILIKYVNKVITVSDSIANEYSKLYKIKKPFIILNTPEYKEIKKKNIFRETLGITENQIIFLYQGGLLKGRGIELILETFKSIDKENTVVVFLGNGPLENLIKNESEKFKNIFYHKAVPPHILIDYTSSADFGILFYENICLNHYYCSPNKLFEYIMAEIPIIASNLYEMRKIVENNRIGVVSEENTAEGLKEAVKKILKMDKNELIKNIRKTKLLYNWENQEKILTNIYSVL